MTLVLRYAARSDRGLVRSNNEDSVYAGARLLALADGMGGHAAGEVASQLVIAALAPLDDDEPGGDLLDALADAVHAGNGAIADHVRAEPELDGMGTTLTAFLFAGKRLGMVHIGDSRAYLMRDGELTQISKDDTFVQTLVDEGRITPEQAHNHPQRSLIMRALTGAPVEPTLIMREAHAGDRYLLCSDGLSDPVSHETIAEALEIPDVSAAADRLIELALRSGGPDNVTVVVADVVELDYGQTRPIVAGAVSTDADTDTPPPNTAAGRAAAIQRALKEPEPAEDESDSETTDSENSKPKKRRLRWLIAAVLVVLIALAGLAIARRVVLNNYYVSAHEGNVSIMQGVQGSLLGYRLQRPDLVGCLDSRGDMSLVSYGEAASNLSCKYLKVSDLRPSERQQVETGLPGGTLDEAIGQLRQLSKNALPPCPPPAPKTPPPPAPTAAGRTPTTTSGTPTTTPSKPSPTTSAGPGASTTPTTTSTPAPAPLPAPPQEPGVTCRTVS
ncbi:Possible serine/threonine phosphatase Ppp [Mycobacteroides abscessus subsp. abscessus]|uniref:Serine/threonine protein phosphatase PstP n=3 Tax=Mycobacteroides abscessus TaxID=36809 RepID=B1ME75_MYCA9|nr:protein phosphatase 2C domain-containing protein [Mycobacteroides abscessus]AMU43858.1 serine/threonine protein phosphatase [Mycobacteroides abscessus]AMU48761.1 serine/threonine protein phosphatase [Mycobacteroides abscessus]ANO07430.1 serine/threonine protein phosphatase [Mycobacteroides abscessus]ANO17193.1 serine/threonine protein phosphatase [Mycobacteroides abscessus]EIC65597.1 serine/threonine phosphatase Ppp [Mycobacteroides abscessus M93]